MFRSDAPDLFPDDLDVARIRDHTVTFAELLAEHTEGWTPPSLAGVHTIAQVHCHQHAALDDWSADQKLLEKAGAEVERLKSGCCGLAGNFGFEAGHGEVSEACAESVLLPALRDAAPDNVILADGFSCRTQVHELDSGGREALHLAEVLDRALRGVAVRGDLMPGDRPATPSRLLTRGVALGAAATFATAAAALLRRQARGRSRQT